MSKTYMEDENSEDLLHYINSLKVLQDRTASRDQFSSQRMKIYNLIEQLMDPASNRCILSDNSRDREMCSSRMRQNSQESHEINIFPNFPTTFPVSLKRLQRAVRIESEDDDLSDLDSDLMDSDEMILGMGAEEQNERLRRMTLPVFFKNGLQPHTSMVINHSQFSQGSELHRPQLYESDEPDVEESFVPSSIRSVTNSIKKSVDLNVGRSTKHECHTSLF